MRKLGQMLKAAIGRDEVLRAARAQAILRRWSEVVGDAMAQRSYPDRYDRGTVWVAVQGSAWAQELRMQRERMLSKLDQMAGEPGLFKDMRFGVRPLPPPEEPEPPEIPRPTPESVMGLSIREIAARRLKDWPDDGPAPE